MPVSTLYEVVQVSALSDREVRVGLAPEGRIAEYSQRASNPRDRSVIHQDSFVDWPIETAPRVGDLIAVAYDLANGGSAAATTSSAASSRKTSNEKA